MSSRFRAWHAAGATTLLPVIPPAASLVEGRDRKICGKSPGQPNGAGRWYPLKDWQTVTPGTADLARWEGQGANVGLRLVGLLALDLDEDRPAVAAAIAAALEPVLPATAVRTRDGSSRRAYFFRWEGEPAALENISWVIAGVGGKLELFTGGGHQMLIEGPHRDGGAYRWPGYGSRRAVVGAWAHVGAADLERALAAVRAAVTGLGGVLETKTRSSTVSGLGYPVGSGVLAAGDPAELARAIGYFRCETLDYLPWIAALAAMKGGFAGADHWYFKTVLPWALGYGGNTPEVVRDKWDSFGNQVEHGADWLYGRCREHGYAGPGSAASDFSAVPMPTVVRADPRTEAALAGLTDAALATGFADRYADSLRYVALWGKWLRWDGKRWAVDEKRAVTNLVLEFCRDAAADQSKKTIKAALESAKTIAAVERLAACDPRLARSADAWDADPWLLNTPGGVVDLKTGQTGPHRPALQMTKITAVSPAGSPGIFALFLSRVCGGDAELAGFLQRMAGYALTGSTREHALFFLWGSGSNGKSVFLGTVSGMLGDYATTAPMETFTASQHDRHPTELARLRGARLVTANETEKGRRWAEAKIKALTGGDKIAAHFMRQDFFEFTPEFKLVIAGNHRPGLRGVDEAIGRRMNLVPFTVTIPEGERDETLPDKLRGEWEAVMAWAVAGCLEWQRRGLAAPAAVKDATAEYLASEDVLGQWLAERCDLVTGAETATSALYSDWTQWANPAGEDVGRRRRFTQDLVAHTGLPTRHAKSGNVVVGIKLRPPTDFSALDSGNVVSLRPSGGQGPGTVA